MKRRSGTWLLAAAGLLVGLPTLIRLVGDHGQAPLVKLDVALPLAVGPLAAMGLAQLLLRRRRLAVLTAALLALDALWLVPLSVADPVRKGSTFTVLTANLRFGEADPARLVELVRTHRVDVLATEELTPAAVAGLRKAGLQAELPYFQLAAREGPDGCGLWSRYPVTPQPGFRLRFQSPGAVVAVPGQSVLVRVVHPFPPTDGALYRRDNAALRTALLGLPRELPTVVAGDFNATLDNTLFRRLLGDRFRDASETAGSGVHGTWSPNGWPFLLHLDHVLVDRSVDVRSTSVLDLPGSDHDAVLARLVLPRVHD